MPALHLNNNQLGQFFSAIGQYKSIKSERRHIKKGTILIAGRLVFSRENYLFKFFFLNSRVRIFLYKI